MEIEADKYPIKYGYKKEFLSALRKIKNIFINNYVKVFQNQNVMKK